MGALNRPNLTQDNKALSNVRVNFLQLDAKMRTDGVYLDTLQEAKLDVIVELTLQRLCQLGQLFSIVLKGITQKCLAPL
jgi:hypothetical protein